MAAKATPEFSTHVSKAKPASLSWEAVWPMKVNVSLPGATEARADLKHAVYVVQIEVVAVTRERGTAVAGAAI